MNDKHEIRITTSALAEMGLCLKKDYDLLEKEYGQLVRNVNALQVTMREQSVPHVPHVWQVGQYALCSDGVTRRVIEIDTRECIKMHDGISFGVWEIDYIPESPMPELQSSFYIDNEGCISFGLRGYALPLHSWISAGDCIPKDTMERFLALAEWRKLTGRMA